MKTNSQSKIPIIISGILGKMGRAIIDCILKEGPNGRFTLAGGIERADCPDLGKPVSELIHGVECNAPLKSELDETIPTNSVFIEFSPSPDAAVDRCKAAAEKGLGMVIGTTGFGEHQLDQVRECAATIPIVYSPNMSVGVNLLFKLADEVSAILADRYDIEIIDIHHKMKRDAPSGTAAKLADIIAKQVKEKTGEDAPISYGRQPGTPSEKREGKEVVIHSLRTGEVVGEHTLVFAGPGERLEITHRATSRETFAQGALQAAKFVHEKAPALYSMTDVLGI